MTKLEYSVDYIKDYRNDGTLGKVANVTFFTGRFHWVPVATSYSPQTPHPLIAAGDGIYYMNEQEYEGLLAAYKDAYRDREYYHNGYCY